jgi:DNA-directed RNA polymerase subunit RPC12/RpoP
MAEAPFFKMKAPKASHPETRTTLDALHSQKMQQMQEEQKSIETYRKQIEELENRLKTSTNDVEIWSLEQQLERLKKKIENVESGNSVMDYYLRTGGILFDYYDMQDKIRQGTVAGAAQAAKARPGSILAILSDLKRKEETDGGMSGGGAGAGASTCASAFLSTVGEKRVQPNDLLNKYLMSEDPELAKGVEGSEDEWTHCESCGNEMILCMNEATVTCSKCGNKEFILIDSDKPSYKDPPREMSYYAYKKINHFNEWLAQFQAKESTEIPSEIYDQILLQLKKERITNFAGLKRTKLREILRNMGEPKYYEHIPHIINRLSGQNAPFMSREEEERLRHMFREILPSFRKNIPKGRRNFLSYGYILYKFCELLEMDELLACFPLLKNRDKLYIQDQAWKGICKDMMWQFIRTV